ncbi:GGDEF domain-containing protein [Gigaspora margarita]|uniref:GGDEF domain-containing protein n=1 Tax=Gigaspora margarita TaxID=4874 RepID=A0A8H4A967_GIGMA|nr:GGDEF domain-containing protein [Gigaspora margarita]
MDHMEEIKNVDDKSEIKNDVDDADDKNEIKNNMDDMNEMNEIKKVDDTDEIKSVESMNEIENLDDINEIKTVDSMDKTKNVDKIKAEDEIAYEIAKGTFRGFNYEDFQDFQDLSNISDELSEIKYAFLKINELHEFHVLKFLKENDEAEYYNKFKREIKNLKKIRLNENVIKFHGVTKDPSKNFYSIVLEYCGDKNLSEDLEVVSKKGWPYKIKMAMDLAKGIKFIHAENIILCNLNSKNIISYKDNLVITDFSSAISVDSQMKSTIKITDQNIVYVDPTCFDSANKFNKPSDIYSLGVILWEITSGKSAFLDNNGQDIEELKYSLINGERKLPIELTPIELTPVDYKELYCDAWNKNKNKRPPIKDVINCLDDIDLDLVYHDYDIVPEISCKENKSITEAEACLKIIEGSPRNQYLFLPEGEILLGRKNSNYIFIKDQEINKKHAKISNYHGKVEITCFDSKSKIFINGKVFSRSHILERHDMIKIGRSTFQYFPAREFKNNIDPRLKIYNNEYFHESLKKEFNKNKKELCVLFFDLDFFGKINKQYSHDAGNYVLKELSKLIQNGYVRDNDIFARYGGEEFTVLLNNSVLKTAYETAKKIRSSVEAYPFIYEGKNLKITLSMGVSGMNSSVKEFEDLLNHAEEACRKAKEYGRNRVIIWENEQISIKKVSMLYSAIF